MSRFLRYLTHCSTREEPPDQHQPTSDRCALPDWTLPRARSSQGSDGVGASSRVESRRFHLTRPANRRLGQGAISARRRHCPRHPRRDSAGHRQTALRPYDPFGTIQSLERPRDSSRNGVLIGADVGAGVSLAKFTYAAAVDYNEIDEWGPIYLAMGAAYTGVGALVGWAIDSAHSKPHVRFNAPSAETMKIRVAPLLARRKGMAVALSF